MRFFCLSSQIMMFIFLLEQVSETTVMIHGVVLIVNKINSWKCCNHYLKENYNADHGKAHQYFPFTSQCVAMPKEAFSSNRQTYFIDFFLVYFQNFFFFMCVFMCVFKLLLCVNAAAQTLQVYGFSPVWVRMWLSRCCFCANAVSQMLHTNCFSPL